MCGVELLLRDQGFVRPGKPPAVVEHFSEVDARLQDQSSGGVLDAGSVLDALVAQALGAKPEDLA